MTAGGPSFAELERAGWQARAADYDRCLGEVTRHAAAPLLDAAAVGPGTMLLDIACGPGYGAGAAAARGADATGLDIAPAMVAEAARNFPDATFRAGDAAALDAADASVDAVICAFGLLHLDDADAAIAEVARVLKSGGRYAFAVWCPTDRHEFFRLVWGAIAKHGNLKADVPEGPPAFRFADAEECRRTLAAAGFIDIASTEIALAWHAPSVDAIFDMVHRSTVRTPMMLDAQTPAARAAIEAAIRERAEKYRDGAGYRTRWPALMTSARRA